MKRKTVAVIFGGRSGEHEVSIVSAESIMNALDPARYCIVPVGVGKDGRWWTGTSVLSFLRNGATEHVPEDCRLCTLLPDPTRGALLLAGEAAWEAINIDIVFPVLHGTFGEDGTMQGLFELADIPYVGAGVAGSAVAMDKVLQKRLHRDAGLPVTDFLTYSSKEIRERSGDIAGEILGQLRMPLFVKPPNLGSSVGISKVATRGELEAAMLHAAQFDRKVLVEEAVVEAREIEVAVLGNEHPVVSVPGEVVPCNAFYDYDAKYVDGATQLHVPADLPDPLAERIRSLALLAFRALECEGMARVDFLLSRRDDALFLNEVNTIPGFTSISMYPKLFAASGIPYPELLDKLIALAGERHEEKRLLLRTYTPKTDWHRHDG
ncbi:MAG: D-alanine--D-alanine ligase [Bacteroidetes bacterium]|nr:D-alanine--D-alanine ligase [Bacteroidota bacterium]